MIQPAPPPDQAHALMQRIASGDRQALAQVIGLYGRGVRSYCTRALDHGSEGDDAAQEVFLKVWTEARRYDPAKASVATWIYTIALRHCIDRNRKVRVRRFFGLGADVLPEVADPAPEADRRLGARQDLARVRQAVLALPERQRQALLLKVVAEMDTAAIAGVMGAGVGAIEQLLVRARASLRAATGLELEWRGTRPWKRVKHWQPSMGRTPT